MTAIRLHGNVKTCMAVHAIFVFMIVLARLHWMKVVSLALVAALALASAWPANARNMLSVASAPAAALGVVVPDGCDGMTGAPACSAFCASLAILPVSVMLAQAAREGRHDPVPLLPLAGGGNSPDPHPPRSGAPG